MILRPWVQVTLCAVVGVTLAGVMFIGSLGTIPSLAIGVIPYSPDSLLKSITEALNIESLATRRGTEIKILIFRIGSVALASLVAVLWFIRSGGLVHVTGATQDLSGQNDSRSGDQPDSSDSRARVFWQRAQWALAIFLVWVAISSSWSPAKPLAFGRTLELSFYLAWALLLGRALHRQSSRCLLRLVMIILTIAAALGIWYYTVRMEHTALHRLKYPLGNPLFLAAVLLPGIFVAAADLIGQLTRARAEKGRPIWIVLDVLTLGAVTWAFYLTDSRSGMVGLAIALLWVSSIPLWHWKRWTVIALVGLLLVAGGLYFEAQLKRTDSRAETITQRLAAWNYAFRLIRERPVGGWGGHGYTLRSEQYSALDQSVAPGLYGETMLGHAHSELLETTVEFGIVGSLLFVGSLVFLAIAVVHTLRQGVWNCADRTMLLGCSGSLVAMFGQDLTNVALRDGTVLPFFWTMVGVCLALVQGQLRSGREAAPRWLFQRWFRCGISVLVLSVSAVLAFTAVNDFRAERGLYNTRTSTKLSSGQLLQFHRASVALLDPAAWAWSVVQLAQIEHNTGVHRADSVGRGLLVDAARRLRRLSGWMPGFDHADYRLGEVLVELGFHSEARQVFRRQLNYRPFHHHTNVRLASVEGHLPKRLRYLVDALRGNMPTDSWMKIFRATPMGELQVRAGHDMGPEEQILAAVRAALDNNPEAELDHLSRALDMYGMRYQDNRSRDPRLRVQLITAVARKHLQVRPGDYTSAIRYLEQALHAGPPHLTYGRDVSRARVLLEQCYRASGNIEAADAEKEIVQELRKMGVL